MKNQGVERFHFGALFGEIPFLSFFFMAIEEFFDSVDCKRPSIVGARNCPFSLFN